MKSLEDHWFNRLIKNHLFMVLDDFVLEFSNMFSGINQMAFCSGKEVPKRLNYNPICSLPTLSQKD